ncbi:MAG: thiamine-phosphate kinase [Acidobacteriota bacterium]|nr:thiamine-phosphate kinase [Acidobacteriota bacterium]
MRRRTPATMGEDELLAWLRRQDSRLAELLGDDAALLPPSPDEGSRHQAVTVDSQIEGIHFLPGLDPAVVAHRLLAVNLSDLAAVGAEPVYAFLALAAPADFPHKRFFRALLDGCRFHGLRLAGGDLARAPAVTATLTLIGRQPDGGRWVRRDLAHPGDVLWVGGSLGESALGRFLLGRIGRPDPLAAEHSLPAELLPAARHSLRRHLRPEPQLALGKWLGSQPRAAGLDLSDGLAKDLPRLCAASGCGAAIEAASLPAPKEFQALCRALEVNPLETQLGGGEDYVLLFALPPETHPPESFGCTAVGRIQNDRTLSLQGPVDCVELPALGWDHLSPRE